MEAKEIIRQLTMEEKAALLSGRNEWKSRGIKRLGIDGITFSDGPHGIRRQEGAGDHLGLNASLPATCFPTAAAVANSWDEELGEQIGAALGQEAEAQGVNVLLGPGLNMKRSPLCGRNFEYFSEDPYLSGKMAAAYIRGIQSRNVYACPKHFAVNSRETRRMAMNAVVDERTLREIYLTAFEIAVKEGNAKAVMTAYNEVNGSYANENRHLLLEILRGEWGFDGIVVTDWGGSNDHVEGVKCQSNMEMPNPGLDSARELLRAVEEKRITEEEIDKALLPVIEAALYFKARRERQQIQEEEHHELARRAAAASAVLLKNEGGILPLKEGCKVYVAGEFAKKPRYQGAGSSQVNSIKVDTIDGKIGEYNLIMTEKPEDADVVLYFFGLDEISETEGVDRLHMNIPAVQIERLKELSSKNAHVVGILSAGSVVSMPWINMTQGLLHGYLTGQAGATAVLDILTGKVNPSGRLAESYPERYEDCPISNYAAVDRRNLEYREGPFIGYRYYDTAKVPILFPFGYGLSYTEFAYSSLQIDRYGASFMIQNTGMRDGAETAQLYVGLKESGFIRPVKELKGFVKVSLKAGESKQVRIGFDDKTFRCFNTVTNKWETEAGEYQISIGANVSDIRLSKTVAREGTVSEFPYGKEELLDYRKGNIKNIPDEEFARLLGHPIPTEKKGQIEINDAICQLKDAKSGLCRLIYKILKGKLDKAKASGIVDLNLIFIYNMPFRAVSKMTAGMVSREMAQGMVKAANGHFFRGISSIIGGYFRNRLANRKYEELLENANR